MPKFEWRACDIVSKNDDGIIYKCPDGIRYFVTGKGRVFKEESTKTILIDQIETKLGAKQEHLQSLSEDTLRAISKELQLSEYEYRKQKGG